MLFVTNTLNKIHRHSISTPALAAVVAVFLSFAPVAHRIGWSQLPVPILVTVVYAIFIWFLFWLVPITRKSAGVVGAVTVLATLTWMDYPTQVIPVGIILSAIAVTTKCKNARSDDFQKNATLTWLIVAALLVAWSIVASAAAWSGTIKPNSDSVSASTDSTLADFPDIYLIIPDRMTGIDGLHEFGVSTGDFEKQLRALGFHVKPDQMSIDPITPDSDPVATTRTLRFMASVLNRGASVPLNITYNNASRAVKNGSSIRDLKALGYEFYNVGSWYTETRIFASARKNYAYQSYSLSGIMHNCEFEIAVVDRSILRYLNLSPALPSQMHIEVRRAEHTYQKAAIKTLARETRDCPTFVMAHLMLPHVPYVWSQDGGYPNKKFGTRDLYVDQAKFALLYLSDIATEIVTRNPEAIIIIQSDEGCLFSKRQNNVGLSETQWNGQLSAWRIPGNNDQSICEVKAVEILDYLLEMLEPEAKQISDN